MQTIHTFNTSKKIGDIGEKIITDHFSNLGYEIYKLTVAEQKQLGYDFYCVRPDKKFFIEVKTELKAETTGNIFYETVVNNKPGWCLKYDKDSKVIVIWYLPISKKALCIKANRLKDIDYEKYPYKTVRNTNFIAGGYLIPISDIEPMCKIIENI